MTNRRLTYPLPRWRPLLSAALLLAVLASLAPLPLAAAEPDESQPPSRVVGSVDGRAVTAADVGLSGPIDRTERFDARDREKWELMGRIVTAFGRPILQRFRDEHKIAASAEEIALFQANMRRSRERAARQRATRLRELQQELASADLSAEQQAKLETEQARLRRLAAVDGRQSESEAPEAIARQFIESWKLERELHRAFGGRVIFQQAGPEALDARRRLFEQAEDRGELRFDDPGVRHLFYYYANMKHVVVDAKALDEPWFLQADE